MTAGVIRGVMLARPDLPLEAPIVLSFQLVFDVVAFMLTCTPAALTKVVGVCPKPSPEPWAAELELIHA